MTANLMPAPSSVLVVGSGRWARVIATVLVDLLPAGVPVFLHTVRNRTSVQEWVEQQGLSARVSVLQERPAPVPGMAVVVANAAGDHAEAARWALEHQLPTLVEKPVTLLAADTAALMALAEAGGTLLCAGHVLLFASYFQDFLARVQDAGSLRSLSLRWVDGAAEVRHGETKSYDPAVPVHADCLPHALSLLWAVHHHATAVTGFAMTRGGASETLSLRVGAAPVTIHLERNGPRRERRLEVMSERGLFSLDFATEPGTLVTPDGTWSAGAVRPVADRPMAALLRAFLAAAMGEVPDPRLAVETGYGANLVIDTVSRLYRQTVLPWTAEKLRVSADLNDADLRYRLTEDLQVAERLSPENLAVEMARFVDRHGGESASRVWIEQRLREI